MTDSQSSIRHVWHGSIDVAILFTYLITALVLYKKLFISRLLHSGGFSPNPSGKGLLRPD